ncbi:hypothetical protein NQ318_016214 [Aromia moschata]|uniref:Uncharacterized protein n=1 Tax=Aromia moschata TaxID=1265417 RepID=A0AAV8YDH3_9CUCU|nr:hypothetical protein NQ318_016214 [Aromia moschata]
MNNNLIVRSNVDQAPIKIEYNEPSIKIEYHNPLDSGRVVSQTFLHPSGQPPTKIRKINCNVVLVNGCWDTTNKIPNIIAEMHNVNTEEFTQNSPHFKHYLSDSRDVINPSPRGSDSGIESDCTDGSLSWLLNYKIHELPPVPDALNSENNFQCIRTSDSINSKPAFHSQTVQVPRIIEKATLKEDGNRTIGQSYRYSGPKKPPFTYTELIEYALCEKGELTVSGIYQWIS